MVLKIKRKDIFIIVIYIVLSIMVVTVSEKITYLLFIYMIFNELRDGKIAELSLLKILIYSIIVPDNYLPIVVSVVYGICYLINHRDKHSRDARIKKITLVIILIAIISSILNMVPLINIAFSIIYYIPLFLFLFVGQQEYYYEYRLDLLNALHKILLIEVVVTVERFLCIGFKENEYSDWSVGTFGAGQQVQLCLIMLFMALWFFFESKSDKKQNLITICLVLFVAISTNSWSLLIIAAFGAYVGILIKAKSKKIIIISILVLAIGIIVVIMAPRILPTNIWIIMTNMISDQAFLENRIGKIGVYIDTFYTIPCKSLKNFLIGNGLGNYCSRGALTCTGYYVSSYNRFFDISISENTYKYIMPKLINAFEHAGEDYGSILYRPYSTILAIMGELGVLGVFTFANLIFKIIKKNNVFVSSIIMMIVACCFLENFVEYSKIVIVAFVLINIATKRRKN